MKIHALRILVSLAIACGPLDAEQTRADAGPGKSVLVFDGVGYLHRWSMNHQHEFTPEGQEDLEKWSDMITINVYPDAHDGEALATKANAVLENYKSYKGKVLRTSSVPRTPEQSAEHFIAVVFGRPNFIEVALARFKLVDGLGCSIVYSHRIYGEKIGDQMSAWLKNNGAKKEKVLMEWSDIPPLASLNEGNILPERSLHSTRSFRPLCIARAFVRLSSDWLFSRLPCAYVWAGASTVYWTKRAKETVTPPLYCV